MSLSDPMREVRPGRELPGPRRCKGLQRQLRVPHSRTDPPRVLTSSLITVQYT